MSDLVGNPEDRFSHNEAHIVSAIFFLDLFILAGNDDIHKRLDESEIRPDLTADYRVSCP